MYSIKKNIIALFIPLLISCGSSNVAEVKFEGYRYRVRLSKLSNEVNWVEVQGSRELFVFSVGVFKDTNIEYYEPQFFGASQACNAVFNGDFKLYNSEEEAANTTEDTTNSTSDNSLSNLPAGGTLYKFNYEPTTSIKGICNSTSRILSVYLQPSGSVDLIDGKKAYKLERIEKIK